MSRGAFVFLAACAAPTSSELVVSRIEPDAATNEAPVSVRIEGTFHLAYASNLQNGATVAAVPIADVGGVTLAGTTWESETSLLATVPAGLAPGPYDVTVQLGGASANLPAGYTVLDNTPPPPPAPFALSGHDWLLPCTTNNNPNPTACLCSSTPLLTTRTVGGMPGERWHVTVRVRGVLEYMTYQGGTPGPGHWYVGGMSDCGGNNVYMVTVSSPAATFFLNHNANASQNHSWAIDYMATFDVDAGATLTFSSSGSDGIQWEGVDASDQPISIAGITDPPQPYNGQFAQLDVIDAVPF